MPTPEQRVLRNNIFRLERDLLRIQLEHGKDSREHHEALKQLARFWAILKMTRSREEFLEEILG